jgi:hypothetical protein
MKPTQSDYDKIISFGSADTPAPAIEDLEVFRFIAADNTIGRSDKTWSNGALRSIAARLVGMPFTTDHDWSEIEDSFAVVFKSKVFELNDVPKSIIDNYAYAENKKIIEAQGWTPVVIWMATYTEAYAIANQIEDVIRFYQQVKIGAAGKVSIGGFDYNDILCPLCNVSFTDRTVCSHTPPEYYWEEDENTAPYTIRDKVTDMGEISMVLIPNSPSCSMITNGLAPLFA